LVTVSFFSPPLLIKDGKMRATLKAAEKILINEYTALLLLACAAPPTSDSPNLALPRLGFNA
jgi:hypothetical protein